LFDGCAPASKEGTCWKRYVARRATARKWLGLVNSNQGRLLAKDNSKHLMPPYAKALAIDVLRGADIACEVCCYEADDEVLRRAAELGAAAMSNDSDFFLFPLEGGYIPLDRWEERRGSCKVRFAKLCVELELSAEETCRLPCYMGNDAVPQGAGGVNLATAVLTLRRQEPPPFPGIAPFDPLSPTLFHRPSFTDPLSPTLFHSTTLRDALAVV
jgi:hypothetical protein